jgi:hypothetical protein
MSVAPLQFLLLVFAGWVNRRQAAVLEYLHEENVILREQLALQRSRELTRGCSREVSQAVVPDRDRDR